MFSLKLIFIVYIVYRYQMELVKIHMDLLRVVLHGAVAEEKEARAADHTSGGRGGVGGGGGGGVVGGGGDGGYGGGVGDGGDGHGGLKFASKWQDLIDLLSPSSWVEVMRRLLCARVLGWESLFTYTATGLEGENIEWPMRLTCTLTI
jgi:hypothetical protein